MNVFHRRETKGEDPLVLADTRPRHLDLVVTEEYCSRISHMSRGERQSHQVWYSLYYLGFVEHHQCSEVPTVLYCPGVARPKGAADSIIMTAAARFAPLCRVSATEHPGQSPVLQVGSYLGLVE